MNIRGSYQGSSFSELLEREHPQLRRDFGRLGEGFDPTRIPHGTTVLASKYADGVIVAGDRLATEGSRVASRDIEKVLTTDHYSLMAIVDPQPSTWRSG